MNILTFSTTPDQGVQQTVKPRILRAQPGGEGGHATRASDGLNNLDETWQLSWLRRTPAEAAALLAFFRARGGTEPFAWTSPRGVTGLWVCPEWTAVPETAASWTVTAKFERDWNLYEVKTSTTPTWDPSLGYMVVWGSVSASNAAIVYSDANRTAANTAMSGFTLAALFHHRPRKSGKWYFELTIGQRKDSMSLGWVPYRTDKPATPDQQPRSVMVNSVGAINLYGETSGAVVSSRSTGFSLATGNVWGFAIDIDAGAAWVRRNGAAWFGGGDPAAGTTPTVSGTMTTGRPFAMIGTYNANGGSNVTVRSASEVLLHACPAGFTPFGDASDPALDY